MSQEIPEFPEPATYANRPGWVKSNPQNNPSYLAQSIDVFPELADQLAELDRQVEALAPGYNISQIKIKFGGLRYYYSLPEGTSREVSLKVRELVGAVEEQSYRLLQ